MKIVAASIYWLLAAGAVITVNLTDATAQKPTYRNGTPLGADDSKHGFSIAAWNIEHLGMPGESCLDRTEEDFAALCVYAELLDADIVAIQEVESPDAVHQVFPASKYNVVLAERPFAGERPLCWWAPSRVDDLPRELGNHFTGFAIRKEVEYEQHAPLKNVGNLDEAGGHASYASDITVQTPVKATRLLAVHLLCGCSDFADVSNPECRTVMDQAATRGWTSPLDRPCVPVRRSGNFRCVIRPGRIRKLRPTELQALRSLPGIRGTPPRVSRNNQHGL